MDLEPPQLRDLLALADRIIPGDEDPSASAAGFGRFLERSWEDIGERGTGRLRAGLDGLDRESRQRFDDTSFAELGEDRQDALLHAIERGDLQTDWPHALAFLWQIITLVGRSYYGDPGNGGNRDAVSWKRIGFRPETKRPFVAPELPPIRTTAGHAIEAEYDAIVIGAGAGGGILACVLAEAGKRVLLLERGAWLSYAEVGRDHLRNHRFSAYGHNTGPELAGNPRVVEARGRAVTVAPHEAGWQNNAMTVGGGTRVYAGQAWRFSPEDFRMESVYGRPADSSLADWPLGYDDLAPFYERAEAEIGVSGELGHSHLGARGPYPMPPVAADLDGPILREAAASLGWNARALPLLINSVPYHGRPACAACGVCVGFACGSEAKGGTANTMIPRALATGRCQLVTGAQVCRIGTDDDGQARAVSFCLDAPDGRGGKEKTVAAECIVLCAGAIESARLLLLSRGPRHPDGLGNGFDQVGRNLQGHLYSGAVGLHADPVRDGLGPGNSTASCDFNHGNPGVIGGGLLANESPFPVHLWSFFLPDLPRWGAEAKRAMAHAYRRTLVVMGPIQEIPNPEARVTLDPRVRDRTGLPVVRLSGTIHPASLPPAEMLRERAHEWIRATGAGQVRSWRGGDPNGLSGGQHQAGTCRMGDDPERSVTDRSGRVHGQRRLFVADGSLHVTNGGYNPVLTIMANAFRVADGILGGR